MSGWTEDNFLEQMAPLLKNANRGVCPDAEVLGAVIDGATGPGVREAVAAHTAGCPACAELEKRLRQFASPIGLETEDEWRQTEKRLDSRMRVILGSGDEQARRPPRWDLRSWKMSWFLAPAAALGIAFLIVSVQPTSAPPPDEIATRPAAPPAATVEQAAPGAATLSAIKEPDSVVSQAPAAASVEASPTETNPPPATQSEGRPQPEPQSAPAEAVAQPPSAADRGIPTDVPSTHASMRRAAGLVATSAQAPGRSSPPPDAAPGSERGSIRINAGTRVWILLKSTSPQTNGDFRFRGMVLLPVTEAGAVLLDRETEVVGVGKVSQGRTTIRIVEFVWQGARYKLRGAAGAMNTPGPGAGPAVEFNAGQVLETWLAAVSTYERVPGDGVRPQG